MKTVLTLPPLLALALTYNPRERRLSHSPSSWSSSSPATNRPRTSPSMPNAVRTARARRSSRPTRRRPLRLLERRVRRHRSASPTASPRSTARPASPTKPRASSPASSGSDEDGKRVKHADPPTPATVAGEPRRPEPRVSPTQRHGRRLDRGDRHLPRRRRRRRRPSSSSTCSGGRTRRVEWSRVSLAARRPDAPRKVRLATVHYQPTGRPPGEGAVFRARCIAEAAQQKADLVVLPRDAHLLRHAARRMPNAPSRSPARPTTSASWRSSTTCTSSSAWSSATDHLVYNVGVLIGPDGKVVGQVPQGLPAARRGRGGRRARATTIRCSTRASARSA